MECSTAFGIVLTNASEQVCHVRQAETNHVLVATIIIVLMIVLGIYMTEEK